MNNALMFIGCLFVAVLAALFGGPYLIDWNGYRGVFEEEASRILGREVRVGGKVNVRLLPAPFVRFEKVRIADTFGQGGEPLFRVEDFTMWLSVSPLLQGVLQAHDVELRKPVVRVATDADGNSNWSNLDINPGQLPFVPSGVKLQSVRVFDGTLIFAKIGAGELLRFEKINGEVGGDAIDGPYKFVGALSWMGQEREVRVATARPEADGTVRFKTAIRPKTSSNSYVIDGRVSDLKGRPKISGDLTASLAFAAARPAPATAPSGPKAPDQKDAAQPGPERFSPTSDVGPGSTAFDLKAKFDGDARRLRFSEIALTREDGGPPQLVTGDATSEWGEKVRLDLALTSKWLDLDRISGATSLAPLAVAQGLVESLVQTLPDDAETRVRLKLDQINLGGSNVSDVVLAISRAEGPLELTELRAGLPGGATVAVKGVLTSGAEQPGFRGPIDLRGQSLARFMAWGMKDQTLAEGRGEVPFSLRAELAIGDKTIELTGAEAELGGVPLKGELRIANEERRKLELTIEGHEIDASQAWAGGLRLSALRTLLLPAARAASTDTTGAERGPSWLDAKNADVNIRLRTAVLTDGELTLRDVDADMRLQQDRVSIPVLKFTTDDGLGLELEGEVLELESEPKGALRGLVSASNAAALTTLAKLFGEKGPDATLGLQLAPLTPARLAVKMGFGERTPRAADFVVDGIAGGGRISASISLDGGIEGWRGMPVDIAATIDTPDARRLVSVLADNAAAAAAPSLVPQRGIVLVKAIGVPEKGLVAQASIGAQELALAYDGRIVLAAGSEASNGATLDGEVRFSARSARDVLAVAGVTLDGSAGAAPMEGIVGLVRQGGSADFALKRVSVGTSLVTGRVSMARREGATTQVTADLDVDRASIVDVVHGFARPPAAAAGPVPAEIATKSLWPERPFDFAALGGIQGDVKVRVASLELDPGLGITDAVVEGSLAPGKVTIARLNGATLGGQVTVSLTLEKATAGAKATGTIKISDAMLDLLGSAVQNRTSGARANVTADFAGQGLSPASIVSALRGSGNVEVADLTLKGMAPWTVVATAESALNGSVASSGEGLSRALRDAIQQGELKFGARKIPFTIGDGAVKVAALAIEGKDGKTSVETTLDLATLEVDAEWKLEPRAVQDAGTAGAAAIRKTPIPAISVVYVGKLGQLAIVEPRIATGALERELAVRKMELDVDALERLRKLDEERAQQESDRQKALDAEAAKAAAAAAEGQANDRPAAEEPLPPTPPVPGSSALPADPALATAPAEVRPVPTAAPRPRGPSAESQRRRSAGEEIMKQLRPF